MQTKNKVYTKHCLERKDERTKISDKQFFKLLRTDKTTLSFAEWMQMYCLTELSISKKHLALYRKLCKDLWACPNCGRINTDRDLLCACMLERIGP